MVAWIFCQFDIFDRNDWEDGSSSDWSWIAALRASAKRVVVAQKYNLPCFQLVLKLACGICDDFNPILHFSRSGGRWKKVISLPCFHNGPSLQKNRTTIVNWISPQSVSTLLYPSLCLNDAETDYKSTQRANGLTEIVRPKLKYVCDK